MLMWKVEISRDPTLRQGTKGTDWWLLRGGSVSCGWSPNQFISYKVIGPEITHINTQQIIYILHIYAICVAIIIKRDCWFEKEWRGKRGVREGDMGKVSEGKGKGYNYILIKDFKKLKNTNKPELVVLGPVSELALLTMPPFLLFVFCPTLLPQSLVSVFLCFGWASQYHTNLSPHEDCP